MYGLVCFLVLACVCVCVVFSVILAFKGLILFLIFFVCRKRFFLTIRHDTIKKNKIIKHFFKRDRNMQETRKTLGIFVFVHQVK